MYHVECVAFYPANDDYSRTVCDHYDNGYCLFFKSPCSETGKSNPDVNTSKEDGNG